MAIPPVSPKGKERRRLERSSAPILIIDDSQTSRSFITKAISKSVSNPAIEAASAESGLETLEEREISVIILDHNLPELSGLDFLNIKNRRDNWRSIPVLVMTADDYDDRLVESYLSQGALDFFSKRKFQSSLFAARLRRGLQLRDLFDSHRRLVDELSEVKEKQASLISNMLPTQVADEILMKGSFKPIFCEEAAVIFADVCGFTAYASSHRAVTVVSKLNSLFTRFEEISRKFGLTKIKTIGDEYMAATGLFGETFSLRDVLLAANEMINETVSSEINWQVKTGIGIGPVVGGVIGKERYQFDIWGNTVNIASRMCSASQPSKIAISIESLRQGDYEDFDIEIAEKPIKGIGKKTIGLLSACAKKDNGGAISPNGGIGNARMIRNNFNR